MIYTHVINRGAFGARSPLDETSRIENPPEVTTLTVERGLLPNYAQSLAAISDIPDQRNFVSVNRNIR